MRRLPSVALATGITFVVAVDALVNHVPWHYLGLDLAWAAAVVAALVGPRRRGADTHAWGLLASAVALYGVATAIRPVARDLPALTGLSEALVAAAAVTGTAGVWRLLRRRGGTERYAVGDAVMVALAGTLIATTVFAIPAAHQTSGLISAPAWALVVRSYIPVLHGITLLLLLDLGYPTGRRLPSFWWLITGSTALTLASTWTTARMVADLPGTPLGLSAVRALACLGFAAAAVHPSVRELSRTATRPPSAWSPARLLPVIIALATPFVTLALVSEPSVGQRVAISGLGLAICLLLLGRSVAAARDYVQTQAVLRHQASHDVLTGLRNRAGLVDEVERMLRDPYGAAQPVWLLFLDLDAFKLVNDSFGHAAGDDLLVEVARRLDVGVAPRVLKARIGGDEFLLAMQGSWEDAVQLAETVRELVRVPLDVAGTRVVPTVSIGLSQAGTPGATGELLSAADTAMYSAKRAGRDRWVAFDQSMRSSVRERVQLEVDLRAALDQGELRLVYQPIVDLRDGRLAGAEALVRWQHPLRGVIEPTEFIPVAEETGLVVALGRWVLREAVEQLARWSAAGTVPDSFTLSVNVSTRQLRDFSLGETARLMLAESGVAPDRLTMEITESVMLEESDTVWKVLQRLRELGIRLAVDDFGTGYSSLGYLSKYPMTAVKVDRSFVAGLGSAPEDEAVVRAVAAIAGALDLAVVAEGVEVPAQREYLKSLGIRFGQGFLWSPPVDAATFAARFGVGSPVDLNPDPVDPDRLDLDRLGSGAPSTTGTPSAGMSRGMPTGRSRGTATGRTRGTPSGRSRGTSHQAPPNQAPPNQAPSNQAPPTGAPARS